MSNLPANATAGQPHHATTTVTYFHATVAVYSPAPDGASYVQHATCTHNHPDSREGVDAMRECGERLRKIINQGRLPKWATLSN